MVTGRYFFTMRKVAMPPALFPVTVSTFPWPLSLADKALWMLELSACVVAVHVAAALRRVPLVVNIAGAFKVS